MKKKVQMTRSEALVAIGTMAAGVPFLPRSICGLTKPLTGGLESGGNLQIDPVLKKAVARLEYLSPADKFIVQRRGNPVLTEIPSGKLAAIGLTPETWKLEIIADQDSDSKLGRPMSIENGNPFMWSDLMKLADKHAVCFLHVLACTNAPKPYGMGLWEGVPLRDVLWLARPEQNIRRIFYYGYHNDDPKQLFQSSLPVNRVLEEAPGELPVILCYKLNGRLLTQANGGPVRLIVPGLYGNRSIKWLQRILVTNIYNANDTYAEGNNDVESPLKTCAHFIHPPDKVKAGEEFAITGQAQVGMSGLSKVQYWINPAGKALPENDAYLTNGEWKDAIILPPPEKWGNDLPGGKLPKVMQIDSNSGQPLKWPLPNTIVHWGAVVKVHSPGQYDLRCRTIDKNGIAQPLPRPFGRSGINVIETARFEVEV
jgi:hypothetical protein